jgi:flotillin
MVIEKLPEIARAVADPLSRIGNITIIGGGSKAGNGRRRWRVMRWALSRP